jgi:Uma2 family endonuclease
MQLPAIRGGTGKRWVSESILQSAKIQGAFTSWETSMSAMTWADVMASPYLKDLPFKIELNKWGKIEMSPASNRHGMVQFNIGKELDLRAGGQVLVECSVQTTDGVRVADIAWISHARLQQLGDVTPFPQAPEVCVEVMSPSNSWAEMEMKAGLYLGAGAEEVWIVGLDGSKRVIRA